MSLLFYYFFVAIGLSMDAFSLAIVYGTNNIRKKKTLILSILVGIFHFIMPNLGNIFSSIFVKEIISYSEILSAIVFGVLAVEMITSIKNEEVKYDISKYSSMILFAFAVSIDSFSIGLVISFVDRNILVPCLIFSLVSFLFTFTGLNLGNLLSKKIGFVSKIIGIIILLSLSIKSLISIFL